MYIYIYIIYLVDTPHPLIWTWERWLWQLYVIENNLVVSTIHPSYPCEKSKTHSPVRFDWPTARCWMQLGRDQLQDHLQLVVFSTNMGWCRCRWQEIQLMICADEQQIVHFPISHRIFQTLWQCSEWKNMWFNLVMYWWNWQCAHVLCLPPVFFEQQCLT